MAAIIAIFNTITSHKQIISKRNTFTTKIYYYFFAKYIYLLLQTKKFSAQLIIGKRRFY